MDRKHRILETAFLLFLKSGFAEVSVNEVIRVAEVTKGGFYHYFKSKEDLIAEVIYTFLFPYFLFPMDDLVEKRKAGVLEGVREELYLCYAEIPQIPCYEEYEGLDAIDFRDFQFLIFEGLKKYQYLADFSCKCSRKHRALIQNILEKGIQQGVIHPDIDPEGYATTMTALRDGIITLHILDESIDAKEKCDMTFQTIWNGLKAS